MSCFDVQQPVTEDGNLCNFDNDDSKSDIHCLFACLSDYNYDLFRQLKNTMYSLLSVLRLWDAC